MHFLKDCLGDFSTNVSLMNQAYEFSEMCGWAWPRVGRQFLFVFFVLHGAENAIHYPITNSFRVGWIRAHRGFIVVCHLLACCQKIGIIPGEFVLLHEAISAGCWKFW